MAVRDLRGTLFLLLLGAMEVSGRPARRRERGPFDLRLQRALCIVYLARALRLPRRVLAIKRFAHLHVHVLWRQRLDARSLIIRFVI